MLHYFFLKYELSQSILGFGKNIFPLEWSHFEPVTLDKQFTSPLSLSTDKNAKIIASLKLTISVPGIIILQLVLSLIEEIKKPLKAPPPVTKTEEILSRFFAI